MTELTLFTDEVRTFISENLTPDLKRAGELCAGIYADQPVALAWHKILNNKGWAVPSWPLAWGGTDWSFQQHTIFTRELTLSGAPSISPNATKMVGPVVIEFGSETQKRHYLPRIRSGEDWWAQGYSEPGSGSDLASLNMKAVRDGHDFVLNGQKTWTTSAHMADWIFCLVRTDNSVKKQEGISFLLIDMKSPGITLKPIVLLDGHAEVNEVFFDDVRVPAANLIGEENKGWTYAKMLLTHERTNIAGVPRGKRRLASLKRIAAETDDGFGGTMANNADFKAQLAEVEIELQALEYAELRTLAALSVGKAPGPESSILKIVGTELAQKMDEMTVELSGYNCLPFVPEQFEEGFEGEQMGPGSSAAAALSYFNNRKLSIFGGSNEVQRNIISKAVLGL